MKDLSRMRAKSHAQGVQGRSPWWVGHSPTQNEVFARLFQKAVGSRGKAPVGSRGKAPGGVQGQGPGWGPGARPLVGLGKAQLN